jgi:Flp pilus assembly pilin Flp
MTIRRFLNDEEGTSTIEYLTVGALAIAIAVIAVRALLTSAAGAGGKAQSGIDSIDSASLGSGS